VVLPWPNPHAPPLSEVRAARPNKLRADQTNERRCLTVALDRLAEIWVAIRVAEAVLVSALRTMSALPPEADTR
jgi:hypothetical protein